MYTKSFVQHSPTVLYKVSKSLHLFGCFLILLIDVFMDTFHFILFTLFGYSISFCVYFSLGLAYCLYLTFNAVFFG